ncbi:hypothetical protein [Salisediminibacterium selenitireducens]|uniref:Lipoprotein n=1 Tax=Bacillus selenitireducens (strain ATCC 700615 / DSM 15326 / MLS10) TaxID=439292 RepID=D6Y0P5_BACIE|nr:hypothetical protein [Salisediminibacterium selenitireducens]ADI00613.1 hypothetical protein Bsel_3131 [[Bacillus] selenitireducens MLS10]
MKKKLLLTMLSGMLTVGFLGACGNVDDLDDNLDNDPMMEDNDPMMEDNDPMNDDM